ncbi:MAG: hypothetical protein LBH93_05460 [Chitinispirillales bacterium]|jgi:dihydrolipoamide dehydrogenase|nr:hypothetical protein [Chitinispirillales bacterium]
MRVDGSGFRYENVFGASRRAAETLSKGVAYLLKKNKVEVIAGSARVLSGHEVEMGAGGRRVVAKSIIVATGSRILSSDDALMMRELPKRALIVGAEVHIAEAAENILPSLDAEVAALVKRSFVKRGMKIHNYEP